VIRISTVIRAVAPVRAQALLRVLAAALPCLLAVAPLAGPAAAQTVRIKDIADFEGVRENMLVGYGLAVGLNGTGDTLNRSIFTLDSLTGMLERLGVNSRLPQQVGQVGTANAINTNLRTRNLAAVMVTANLPAFSRQGDRIDVNVSTMGDATSLLGATLLVTPLLGADGEVYAVAQGNVAIGGFGVVGQAQSVTRGVPTNSRIANGAIVEREVGFELGQMDTVRLSLKNPDLTTARRVAQAVNAFLGAPAARSTDPKTIVIQVPNQYRGDAVSMLTDIERLPVEPDQVARVIIDEHAGVIVMGENVRISTVAVAQANLTIRVTETPQVSQPSPFAPGASGVLPGAGGFGSSGQFTNVPRPRVDAAGRPVVDAGGNPVFDLVPQVVPGSRQNGEQAFAGGATVVVPRTNIEVDDQSGRRLAVVPAGITIGELVNGLNALGVGPRDLISILQSIKAAGAMQADLEVL
jgi:flagellar P-ring protein precursor FlgI